MDGLFSASLADAPAAPGQAPVRPARSLGPGVMPRTGYCVKHRLILILVAK